MIDSKTILEGKVAVYISGIENSKDRVAAKQLLEMTADLLETKKTMPDGLQDWLAQGLRRLIQGQSATAAFGLPSKSKKDDNTRTSNLTKQEFEREVGEFIDTHPAGKHKATNKDGTVGAHTAAAEKYNIGENMAGDISKRYYAQIEDEWLINEQFKRENEPDQ